MFGSNLNKQFDCQPESANTLFLFHSLKLKCLVSSGTVATILMSTIASYDNISKL